MSVNARRHRLNMCLGGLVGYDVLPSAKLGTSLLHTQKVASSSLASSTFFFFTPPMPLRRPTALFGRLCKKNFIKCCSEPVLPFAGLQTPAKCEGGDVGFKNKKKLEIILIYAYFAYRIELMTSRMLSRRLQFRCFVRIYQLSYIPKSGHS